MTNQWRDRVKQLGDSVPQVSKKVKKRIEESAPEVSKRVRQQFNETTPLVAHRVREVGKALTTPVPSQATTPEADSLMSDALGVSPQFGQSDGAQSLSPPVYFQSPVGDVNSLAKATTATIPSRPTAVYLAYLALVVAAVASASLAGLGIYGLTELRGSVDKVLHLDPTGTAVFYARGYVDNAETTLMSSAVALGILFALAYVLVAHAVRKGNGWPRPIGTALAVLSLPAVFLGPVAVVIVVAGIVAVLALWTPSARHYAVQSKAAKRLARQR
jgi:hypothetical protein